MTTKELRARQKAFLEGCLTANVSLDVVLDAHRIDAAMFAGWLQRRDFRLKLHATIRAMRRAQRLQLHIGAVQATAVLIRTATESQKVVGPERGRAIRSACVDLIRLARDSRARASGHHAPADVLNRRRREEAGKEANADLYHPDVAPGVARELIAALEGPAKAQATDK